MPTLDGRATAFSARLRQYVKLEENSTTDGDACFLTRLSLDDALNRKNPTNFLLVRGGAALTDADIEKYDR